MMPPRKRVVAVVSDLPPIVEAMAEEARSKVYQDPFPEPLSVEAINRLLADEVIGVECQDSDGAHRALAGPVILNTPTKLVLLNVATAMYTAPQKETIRFGTGKYEEPIPLWAGNQCRICHPNEKVLSTVQRLMKEKSKFSLPEETKKEKKQKMLELTPREIALALLKVVTKEPQGRGLLCKLAGIEAPKDKTIQVLEALAKGGKILRCVELRDGLKIVLWRTVEV